jgi:hypothetical protein
MDEDFLGMLRSLRESVETELDLEPRNTRGLTKQIKKIRSAVREVVRKATRAYCNCRETTAACSANWRAFLDEMNTPCQLHGVRRLGIIVSVTGYPEDGDPDDLHFKRVLGEYHRRIAALQSKEAE